MVAIQEVLSKTHEPNAPCAIRNCELRAEPNGEELHTLRREE